MSFFNIFYSNIELAKYYNALALQELSDSLYGSISQEAHDAFVLSLQYYKDAEALTPEIAFEAIEKYDAIIQNLIKRHHVIKRKELLAKNLDSIEELYNIAFGANSKESRDYGLKILSSFIHESTKFGLYALESHLTNLYNDMNAYVLKKFGSDSEEMKMYHNMVHQDLKQHIAQCLIAGQINLADALLRIASTYEMSHNDISEIYYAASMSYLSDISATYGCIPGYDTRFLLCPNRDAFIELGVYAMKMSTQYNPEKAAALDDLYEKHINALLVMAYDPYHLHEKEALKQNVIQLCDAYIEHSRSVESDLADIVKKYQDLGVLLLQRSLADHDKRLDASDISVVQSEKYFAKAVEACVTKYGQDSKESIALYKVLGDVYQSYGIVHKYSVMAVLSDMARTDETVQNHVVMQFLLNERATDDDINLPHAAHHDDEKVLTEYNGEEQLHHSEL